jgi:hypothetical protein
MHGILEHRGRKQIAGIVCRRLNDIPLDFVRDTIYEAVELDRSRPYRHPGKQ